MQSDLKRGYCKCAMRASLVDRGQRQRQPANEEHSVDKTMTSHKETNLKTNLTSNPARSLKNMKSHYVRGK